MNDRFKFRAWDKDSNSMIFTDFSDGSWSNAFWFDIRTYSEQFVLMQSTGLRDKNGTLIFEFMELDKRLVVIWRDGRYVLQSIIYGDVRGELNEAESREREITREYVPLPELQS